MNNFKKAGRCLHKNLSACIKEKLLKTIDKILKKENKEESNSCLSSKDSQEDR